MRVAVLGASGFIGRSVVRRLRAEPGFELTAFTRELPQTETEPRAAVKWKRLDLTSTEDVDIEGFDVLVDCSGLVNQRGVLAPKRFYDFVDHQLRWTERFFRAGCKRFVGLSSGGTIYGETESLPISELEPTNPISAYGKSKLLYEKAIAEITAARGAVSCILRVANACGSGQPYIGGFGLIPTVTKALLSSEPIIVTGDGSAVRDYVDVQDIAEAVALAALRSEQQRIMNVGSGVGRTTLEVIRQLATLCGIEPRLEFFPAPRDMIGKNVLDCSLLESLGWRRRIPFSSSLEGFLRTLRKPGIAVADIERDDRDPGPTSAVIVTVVSHGSDDCSYAESALVP